MDTETCNCPLRSSQDVKYEGDLKASIIFIGESPGTTELKKQRPFIGLAGSLLRRNIAGLQIPEHMVFYANSARCLIDKKTLPDKEIKKVLKACRPTLVRAIKHIKPKLLVLCGDFALRQVMKRKGITKNRGTWFFSDEFNCHVLPTFHPSYCLRFPETERFLREDLKEVKDFIDNDFERQTIKKGQLNYKIVPDLSSILDGKKKIVGLDTEDQGLDWANPNYVMISFSVSVESGHGIQIRMHKECPVNDPDMLFTVDVERKMKRGRKLVRTGVKRCTNYDKKLEDLEELLTNPIYRKAMQNGNFDNHVFDNLFARHGKLINVAGYDIDTQAAAQVINENLYVQARLEIIQRSFTDFAPQYAQEFDRKYDKADMLNVPAKKLAEYACPDSDVTRRAALTQVEQLKKIPKLAVYFSRFVMPTLKRTLFTLEKTGSLIDMKKLPCTKEKVKRKMDAVYAEIIKVVPEKVYKAHFDAKKPHNNVALSRSAFVKDILFTPFGFNLKPIKSSLTGPSADQKVRAALLRKTLPDAARTFLTKYHTWQELHNFHSRNLEGFRKCIKHDNRIHSSFSLTVAKTGRVSSCVAKGTKVDIVRDVSEYPKGINIEDVKVGDLAYTYDINGNLTIRKVLWSGKTGTKEVVRVHYMSRGHKKRGYVEVTPEHGIKNTDLEYVEAQNLKVGDSVMSMSRRINEQGYAYIIPTGLSFYNISRKRQWSNQFGSFVPNNHIITKVERIGKVVDVYNLEIEDTHNFIANEINVKNSAPNLQNIPKRSKLAPIIRELIIAPPGWKLLAIDSGQAELRWIASIANEANMMKVFLSGEDIHTATAELLTGKSRHQMDKKELKKRRFQAKAVNFGLIYGMGVPGFINYCLDKYELALSFAEAENWKKAFFRKYPNLTVYHRDATAFCKRNLFVESPLGRRRRLPEINDSKEWIAAEAMRQAINHPVQSASSDSTLLTGNEIIRKGILDPRKFVMSLFVHDELIFEVKEEKDGSNVVDYAKIIKHELENPPLKEKFGYTLRVPLKGEVSVGQDLAHMDEMEL